MFRHLISPSSRAIKCNTNTWPDRPYVRNLEDWICNYERRNNFQMNITFVHLVKEKESGRERESESTLGDITEHGAHIAHRERASSGRSERNHRGRFHLKKGHSHAKRAVALTFDTFWDGDLDPCIWLRASLCAAEVLYV